MKIVLDIRCSSLYYKEALRYLFEYFHVLRKNCRKYHVIKVIL